MEPGYRWYIDETISEERRSLRTYRFLVPCPFVGGAALLFLLPYLGSSLGSQLVTGLTSLGSCLLVTCVALPFKECVKRTKELRKWRMLSVQYATDCESDSGSKDDCQKLQEWLFDATKPED